MIRSCHILDLQVDSGDAHSILERLSSVGVIDPILILDGDGEDFGVSLISSGAVTKTDALTYLSSLSKIDVVTLTVVVGPATSPDAVSKASERMNRRSDRVRTMVSMNTDVREVRVFAPSFDVFAPPVGYFSDGAINVILIPEDRASDQAVARPADGTSDWFPGHVVVEIASLLGLWSGIDEPPVLSRSPRSGGLGEPLVHQFRSFCRIVRGPSAVATELLPEEGVLPTPVGFSPAPDPVWLAREFAGAAFPREFQFEVPPYVDPRATQTFLQAFIRFLREFGRTFVGLPRFLFRGLVVDLNQAAGRSLQNLYGEHSWVQIKRETPDSDEPEQLSVSEDELRKTLAAISERPSLAISSPTVWTKMVHDVLGAADGSDDAPKLSQFGSSKALLLVDQKHLGYPRDVSPQRFAELAVESEDKESASEAEAVDHAKTEPQEHSESVPSLLSFLTERFREQVKLSRDEMSRAISEVLRSGNRQARVSEGTARGVVISLLLAISAFLLTLISTTTLHRAFSFEQMSSLSRARLWVLFSLLVAFVVGLCLAPRKTARMQTFVIALTSGFAASVVIVLLFFRPVYRGVRRILDWSGDVPVYALTGAVAAIGVIALLRHLTRTEARGSLAVRILGATLYLYLMIGAAVALSRDGSVIQSMSQDSRQNLQILFFTVSIVGVLSSLGVVTAVRVREQNSFQTWISRLRWNVKVAEYCAAEEKLHAARLVQWLGTASSLSRLIWHPLGRGGAAQSRAVSEIESLQLQKFKMAEVVLVDRGLEAYTARIRRLVAGKGWLTSQYERVVTQFGKERALRSGLLDGDLQSVRPETCSFPENPESIAKGRASSRRWEFALEFESGMYDSVLAERSKLEDEAALFSSVLADPRMYDLSGSNLPSIREFLDEAMVHGRPWLPSSGVRSAPVALAGQAGTMEASTWWPNSVIDAPGDDQFSETLTSRLVDSTLVAMRTDWSNPVGFSQLAGVSRSDGAQAESHLDQNRDQGGPGEDQGL